MKASRMLRAVAALLLAGALIGLFACSRKSPSSPGVMASLVSAENEQHTIYGKVTAIDGSQIIFAPGTWSRQDAPASGAASERFLPTGKSESISISSTSILTRQVAADPGESGAASSAGSPAALSDITVGTILKIDYGSSLKDLISVQITHMT